MSFLFAWHLTLRIVALYAADSLVAELAIVPTAVAFEEESAGAFVGASAAVIVVAADAAEAADMAVEEEGVAAVRTFAVAAAVVAAIFLVVAGTCSPAAVAIVEWQFGDRG